MPTVVPFIDLSVKRSGQGVIWVNSSHENCRYIREAEKSARTVKRFLDNASFILASDRLHEDLDPVFNFQTSVQFHVPEPLKDKIHFNGQMVAKLSVLKHMTWEKNLYLGSDVVALRPGVEDILQLLNHFDIVVAHAPFRINTSAGGDEKLRTLPDCFPEMNCDLIAYNRSDYMGTFLAEWERIYSNNLINHGHDQGAFRYLLLHSQIRLYILPPEYNYRGYEFSPNIVNLQRREAIPLYAKHFPHIADIYGKKGLSQNLLNILRLKYLRRGQTP